MSALFTSIGIGRYTLPNRLIMAPMTRSRADEAGVQGEISATYYAQRAGAGLIISEGVFPSAMGRGYMRIPGVETKAQIAGWRRIADAVHAKGGRIFMQLMHCGRVSHPSLLPGGALPVAPSAIRPKGKVYTANGPQDFVVPYALRVEEIAMVIDSYRRATHNALEAGMDGVELHAASGYLPDQFLSSGTNQRQDAYGGAAQHRARFVVEVLQAMAAVAGGDRVGIKIAPEMGFNDVHDANPVETYGTLVDHLAGLDLAYLHVALFGAKVDYHALLKPKFKGAYLAGGGLDQAKAEALISTGAADGAVFGAAFMANPDLPERFRRGAALNTPDKATFYAPGAKGYTDYPALDSATLRG